MSKICNFCHLLCSLRNRKPFLSAIRQVRVRLTEVDNLYLGNFIWKVIEIKKISSSLLRIPVMNQTLTKMHASRRKVKHVLHIYMMLPPEHIRYSRWRMSPEESVHQLTTPRRSSIEKHTKEIMNF